ncbi:DUF2065 family protein [Oceaniglobus trochenteri]|uniref:DUF2065 family protein n=1 Tax=Oceaniglobus trochenteri TaxID=2763260 RepID=UPI001FD9055C|nr:DUF2065 family protein [Oceaniglobus trochenteri]
MIATALLALGLVLSIEGLVFALAPSRLEEALEALRRISPETRRFIGLGALALGVLLVWGARALGAGL